MVHTAGSSTFRSSALALACLVFLGGCKEVLYSELREVEANEMVAVLAAAGIPSTRESDKKGVYSVLVEGLNVAGATTILKNQGYPNKHFASLGDVFGDSGVVGTPFEERARFMHALNQELSQTLVSIDGIRDARVHVTLPQKSRHMRDVKPAQAAISLHHEPEFGALKHVPAIKTLVAHAVPDLSYDDVAVALFVVSGPSVEPAVLPDAPPISTVTHATVAPVLEALQAVPSQQRLAALFGTLGLFLLIIAWRESFGKSRRKTNDKSV